ncbi:MAG: hypothetical protein AAF557_19525 [Pseudomonadota bacterium]
MADNKVTDSIETPGGDRCVDLFRRPDGSWGFEEYRRDPEDGTGWFQVGFHRERRFQNRSEAVQAALETVVWLKEYISEL